MYITFTLSVIIVIAAYVAIKHEKWKYMLVSTILAIVIVLRGYGILDELVACTGSYVSNYQLSAYLLVAFLTFISTAALWSRNRDKMNKETRERKRKTDYISKIKIAGFVEGDEDLRKTGWEKYIKTLGERLSKTRLCGESFALGIAGDWGSGKTTFLSQLRPELEKSFQVVDFNPWACTDANIVIADFFNTLKAYFPKSDKELLHDINHYVRLLTDADILPKPISALTGFGGVSSNSLTSLKTQIEERLKRANNRYAIIIDDLDRLQQDELFEILRLIRITASFSNIVFVVTYDRHHIQSMLQQYGISEGLQYVKKIFNTEVILPGVEPYTLPMMLKEEIEKLLGDNSQIPAVIDEAIFHKSSFETYDLLCYLKNFRDVKRFAMAFAANATTVENYSPGEFSFPDFFWLEILRYIDYDTYSTLRVNPSEFLTLSNNFLKVKENLPLAGETQKVLNQLFSTHKGRPQNSIVYMHNFHNYFSYRIQDNKLSQVEFQKFLQIADLNRMKEAVGAIFAQRKQQSLVQLFNNMSVCQLATEQEKLNYITLMFALIPQTSVGFIPIIKDKLQKSNFLTNNSGALKVHVTQLLHDFVENGNKQRNYINQLLTNLYSDCYYDSTDEYSIHYNYESIIDDTTLVEESEANLRAIFAARKQLVDITEVTAPSSNLRKFLENATTSYATDVTYQPIESYYKCLPFNALLDYFSQHQSDKLDLFMEPFAFKDDEKADAEDYDVFNSRLHEIEKVFGSLKDFAVFTYKCFTNPDEEKDQWIVNYWKIKRPT